ncbi:hypothetical protein [Azohydromonas aeria]|uniref:hypothetical protein n=1 Tax=Azohydromonas aeria TaxID=2590212 RepID=UPI0012F7DB2D|nr:hypothetical protein [Azohydromonas aeria]
MNDDFQDKPPAKAPRRRRSAAAVIPVGLGRQASAPLVEGWGLAIELQRPVPVPVLLSRTQAATAGRALVEALYPQKAQREALARAGQVLVLADGLMSRDSFDQDQDVGAALEELRGYLARVLPAAPGSGESRTPWMGLTDCFQAGDRSDDTAAFAASLYDEPASASLCLPFFRAHFEHQGPASDPFGGVFRDPAYRPCSVKLYQALADALGVEAGAIQGLALVPLRRETRHPAGPPAADEDPLEFGSVGYESVLRALAERDKHQLDACDAGEELARALRAMRAQAADEQAAQFGWRRNVAVVVRPGGEVCLGFATVDEMGDALRSHLDGCAAPGELVASRWEHWLMEHYIPVLQEAIAAGCAVLAFSAPALAEHREAKPSPAAGAHDLPLLDAVVIEEARGVRGDLSEGVLVQAWRCLALLDDAKPQRRAAASVDGGTAFLLCTVLLVVDADGHPVQQVNLFHSTPFAADVLQDSARHHAETLKLPLQWRHTLLHVGDESLQLTVGPQREVQVSARNPFAEAANRQDH